MTTLLTIIHIAVCFFLIVIVLLQQGKGANMGATFGGSSQTVFGTEGPMPLLNKVTTLAAITFMVTSVALAYISAHKSTSSVMKDFSVQKPQENAIQGAPPALPQQPTADIPLAPAEPLQKEGTTPSAPATGEATGEKTTLSVGKVQEKSGEPTAPEPAPAGKNDKE
ncbi:MAG: preprotein translocase subunit SecG [Thermodesulfobacteriota bacterium]